MKRLSTKLFLGNLAVIIIFSSLILVFAYKTISTKYTENLSLDLHKTNKTFQYLFIEYYNKDSLGVIDQKVKQLKKEVSIRITIVNLDGKVIADSDYEITKMDNHSNRPEIENAYLGKQATKIRFSNTLQKEMLYVASPIVSKGEVIAVSRMSVPTVKVYDLIYEFIIDILKLAVWIILFSIIAIVLFTRSITKPINKLSLAVANIASGDFDYKVKIKGRDEIASLSANFNSMTLKLKELFTKVDSQREELNMIFSTINEGFVVVDVNGVVLLANQKFTGMFDVETEDVEGTKIKKILKVKELNKLFKDTLKNEKGVTREFDINESTLIVSSNLINNKQEIVILFHDITELRQFEQVKKDFVINVSHELRTPLTAIKGFVETLENEIEDKNSLHYLTIINRHTNRLIELVQDLLSLSELEDAKQSLVINEFNIEKFVSNVARIFSDKLKSKNLKIEIENNSTVAKIQADKFRIEQLFINLIDNAIKYTDVGFIKVLIANDDTSFFITIEDTGIGIPKEHIDRIFERFYLVSKSRTRKEGGTGLGLSIVKHIVIEHGGTINVESEPGVGTKFLIKLPIVQSKILNN